MALACFPGYVSTGEPELLHRNRWTRATIAGYSGIEYGDEHCNIEH